MTRQDIPEGYQAVQSAHAAIQFQHEHRDIAEKWHDESKYLVLVGIPTGHDLNKFINTLSDKGVRHSVFVEPDIDNEVTSVALEPNITSQKLCSNFPLLLKKG